METIHSQIDDKKIYYIWAYVQRQSLSYTLCSSFTWREIVDQFLRAVEFRIKIINLSEVLTFLRTKIVSNNANSHCIFRYYLSSYKLWRIYLVNNRSPPNCGVSYDSSIFSVSYVSFLTKIYLELSMRCRTLYYSDLFFAMELYGLGKKILRTPLSMPMFATALITSLSQVV